MPGLLISVRSAAEARIAVAGGASVIDVKEPDRGPLGPADPATWQAVRRVVPREIPVSVALGELAEDRGNVREIRDSCEGIAFRKLGLARVGHDWAGRWKALRQAIGPGSRWVAVAYVEGRSVAAPEPEEVLDEAIRSQCAGILLDTFEKRRPSAIDQTWSSFVRRARESGLFVAIAGGLDEAAIDRLMPLEPDLFAVRGAACGNGDRRGTIDPTRVARLADQVRSGSGLAVAAPVWRS